jgi:hypothetical protein
VPRVAKFVLLVVLIAIAVVVLFTTVFPWVEATLDQDPTMGLVTPAAVGQLAGMTAGA